MPCDMHLWKPKGFSQSGFLERVSWLKAGTEIGVGHSWSSMMAANEMEKSLSWRNWANLIAYVVNFAVTYSSLTGVWGKTNTELSAKYQTLVTPAGYAFSIWGPIFIWEGVFAVAQMFRKYRHNNVITYMTPFWISACICQCGWTLAFAQEQIFIAFFCMLGILVSLLVGMYRTDMEPYTISEFWLLRAPFSLHGGWIIAASAVNLCVLADRHRAAPEVMLALAMLSFAGICSLVCLATFASPRADSIIGLVAFWALIGVQAELLDADNLKDPKRFNFYDWPQMDLRAVRLCALVLGLLCLFLAVVATLRRLFRRKAPVATYRDMADDRTLSRVWEAKQKS